MPPTPRNPNFQPLTHEAMRRYFLDGCKKPDDLKIGVEWEKIGVYKDSLKAIRYSGPRGVRAIFKALVSKYGWSPVMSGKHPIALKKRESSITLEPGGQIELSGQKAAALDKNAAELFSHLDELQRVSEPLGIAWLGTGLEPVSTAKNIQWVPKKRYNIMRRSLKNKGSMSTRMMKETASIQISLDYVSEKDAIQKLRLGMALAPFLSAMFANSPVSRGGLSGFYSERAHVWRYTAPERTGIIREVFKKNFNFESYAEFAMRVPMIFITRKDRWIAVNGLTFQDFMKRGFRGHRAVLSDWELHLTSLFTECRLKQYLEIRSVDCQKKTFGLSVPAFIKGIFYDAVSLDKAWTLVGDLDPKERERIAAQVPRQALKTVLRGKTLADYSRKLVSFAGEGLTRLGQKNSKLKNDLGYLEPLERLSAQGRTPADEIMEKFDPKRLVQLLSL